MRCEALCRAEPLTSEAHNGFVRCFGHATLRASNARSFPLLGDPPDHCQGAAGLSSPCKPYKRSLKPPHAAVEQEWLDIHPLPEIVGNDEFESFW